MDSRALSRSEALQFVSECLEITDVEGKLKSNRLQLLNEMIRKFHERIPFTNLVMMSTEPSKRKVPNWDDMIEDVTCRAGGMCVTLNGFFKMLLETLNYNVIFVRGKIYISKIEDPHISVMAFNVEKEGDSYMVDVGIGYPTFQAIPLHDDHLPRDYQFAFHHVRFQKVGDVIVRCHKKTSPFGEMKDKNEDVFEGFIEFDFTPRELSFFHKSMNVIYTNPDASMLLNITYASLYPLGKAITLRDLTLRVWSEGDPGKIDTTTFETHEEAIPVIISHFPTIKEDIARKGFAYWFDLQNKKNTAKNE